MNAKNDKIKLTGKNPGNKNVGDPKDAPWYPADEDIYVKNKEERDLDPEDTTRRKAKNELVDDDNEDFFDESADDLDVPGSELDDDEEAIGNEDEENNYYSIGGDNHNDLEEDNE